MVTCLGQTFTDDHTRREHFRDLLREKLPELKKIEGFPIGEDEDIITLSDPPYYTACPNPWVEDFIEQWEAEKRALENAGKRSADFDVREPYASDVSEGKNNPIYNAHSYHTKVPHPAIMRYILHYTQPGDVVLDGFAGTGMTGVAAQLCGSPDAETKLKIDNEWREMFGKTPDWGSRHAILGDLSPIASFIAYHYNSPVNLDAFETEARRILADVEEECSWIYKTTHTNGATGKINYTVWSDVFACLACGSEIVFWDVAVDPTIGEVQEKFECPACTKSLTKKTVNKVWVTKYDTALGTVTRELKRKPVLINYTVQGKRFNKRPDENDLQIIEKLETEQLPDWVPTSALPDGFNLRQPRESHGVRYIHQFFTKRTLWVLSVIREKLSMQSRVSFAFTAMQRAISNFASIAFSYYFHGGGGPINAGKKGTLYIASVTPEINVMSSFESRLSSVRFTLGSRGKTAIETVSATRLTATNNSVDYIFVDPPFGANIMYSELNFLWEGWLKVRADNKSEAIENKTQGKTLLDYQALMADCFREYFRVLKPGKWMTVEFSNTGAAVWNGIQTALQRAGFIIANVASLDKKQGSMNAYTSPTAVKQDLIISCYKPSNDFEAQFSQHSGEVAVWDFVSEHLTHLPVHLRKGGNTTAIIERSPKILYDRLITFYLMRGLPVPLDSAPFQAGLRQRFTERDGMYFLPAQAAEYDAKRATSPSPMVQMSLLVTTESEGILWLRDALKKPQTYSDLQPLWMQSITAWRKGDAQPELRVMLEQNFIQEADGRWRTPDMEEAADREIFRTRALMKEFTAYKEILQASTKTKKLKEVRVEALRTGFKAAWESGEFSTIVSLADKIPQNILLEDEALLLYYDMAKDRV